MDEAEYVPGIENVTKVDFAGEGEDGRLILGISDHLDWSDSAQHIEAIKAKVNAYYTFSKSEAFRLQFPSKGAAAPRIVIMCAFEPSPEGLAYLNEAAGKVARIGWALEWQHVPSHI